MKALLIAWLAIAAAILWWPIHSTDFRTRWVAMPPAMSFEMLDRARKASTRALWMPICPGFAPGPPCRIG
jgi:hypothetical protein